MASVEANRNVKTAVWLGVLTIASIIILFIFGIPILGKFAGFVSDIGGSKNPIRINDKTPPAPPFVNQLPEYTNQSEVSLTGTSEEGATIKLIFNGDEKETVADEDGNFNFSLKLVKDDNTFELTARDLAGNISQKTKEYKIIFDDQKPEVTIESPQEGSKFYGSGQKEILIKGKTEAESNLTINGKFVSVGGEGNFEFRDSLGEGENKFNIKATDAAGNLTEMDLTVFFTP